MINFYTFFKNVDSWTIYIVKTGMLVRKLLSYFDKVNIVKHGFLGFLLFFGIIIISKLISSILITGYKFGVDSSDFFIASLGFLFVVIIKTIERFSNSE